MIAFEDGSSENLSASVSLQLCLELFLISVSSGAAGFFFIFTAPLSQPTVPEDGSVYLLGLQLSFLWSCSFFSYLHLSYSGFSSCCSRSKLLHCPGLLLTSLLKREVQEVLASAPARLISGVPSGILRRPITFLSAQNEL